MSATSIANLMFGSPAGSKTSLNCVQLGDVPGNVVVISQYSKHASAHWGAAVENWNVDAGGGTFVHAIWKLVPGDARGNGRIRVTVYGNSGSTNIIKLMRPSTLDGTATPDLTGNTTEPGGISTGVTQVLTGTRPFTYQTGYFAIMTRRGASAHDVSITKIEWKPDAGSYETIWLPGGVRQTYICGGVRLG